jgi:hypothetical protein
MKVKEPTIKKPTVAAVSKKASVGRFFAKKTPSKAAIKNRIVLDPVFEPTNRTIEAIRLAVHCATTMG